MSGVYESPKTRINTSMLSQYINRPVCFIGRLEKVHPSGKTLTLSDGEGKTASVELNDPLDEELSGIVEVIGMVSNKGTIMAVSHTQYREDKVSFDLELYNESLKVLNDYPQYYPFEVSLSG
ncbi:replication protein A 14 kDa subunit [Rhinichthys klamathensis goyatoka]|uniref:replication protein A 14 kDa subunit n=1 Tax=Rhinichthys klamathensis goyatoka TaxID=3034132 RepID=UPI0024B499DF|nr:replication protein A 14 kDa subunit [Rhinichthys klamathensis goyatoka]